MQLKPILLAAAPLLLLSSCAESAPAEADRVSASSAVSAPVPAAPVRTITNSLGMKFAAIPAGTFQMGSAEAAADAREKPQHAETVQAFYLGVYEITQADWQRVLGENPYSRNRSNPYYNLPGMAARITKPNHPATVSWNDAQEFIAALNRQDTRYRYRLPTEAEWEYAARAGTQSRYFFGDDDSRLSGYAWYGGNFATGGTHPVGQKQPNPWGLYDIYGNAWEWVQDAYRPSYDHAATTQKTVRGGSWHSTADGWHSAWRKPYDADYRGISIGFRLVAEEK
ncbi:formylglycine-generating enzyme family protein [Eikenella sp. S3360]|uniref:Formylglycine-generating enzyme family protein n=1 Tax=Eikenella glucosivorans TaxID=2766967 RepID=A0ABS0N923_9NEIS|nr:formylglycine-generating enzyme family protein [Eikenella glucosivorans]MBH5328784.1 formylglycine-generating enzyme family protein [Eikenella glucosivorans]